MTERTKSKTGIGLHRLVTELDMAHVTLDNKIARLSTSLDLQKIVTQLKRVLPGDWTQDVNDVTGEISYRTSAIKGVVVYLNENKLRVAEMNSWSERPLTSSPHKYRFNRIPGVNINLETIDNKPTVRVSYNVGTLFKPYRSIRNNEIDELYARVDAHFAELRTQEQEPRQFNFASDGD